MKTKKQMIYTGDKVVSPVGMDEIVVEMRYEDIASRLLAKAPDFAAKILLDESALVTIADYFRDELLCDWEKACDDAISAYLAGFFEKGEE